MSTKKKPRAVSGLLFAWSSLPLLALVGVASVNVLIALGLPTVMPALMAGICLGAALRGLGIASRTVRLWPTQRDYSIGQR